MLCFGVYPNDNPITLHDLGASLLHALGVNPALEVHDGFLRTVPLSTGQVKPELFG